MSAGRSVGETVREAAGHAPPASPFRQPRGVWTVAFACVVSFMGIGLVDPILPALSSQLHASPSAVELLFTSYLVVTAWPRSRPPGWPRTSTFMSPSTWARSRSPPRSASSPPVTGC